jgi:hypothetical protein
MRAAIENERDCRGIDADSIERRLRDAATEPSRIGNGNDIPGGLYAPRDLIGGP